MARKAKKLQIDEITPQAQARMLEVLRGLCIEYYRFLSTQQGHWLNKTEVAKHTDLYYAIRCYIGGLQETRRLAIERFGEGFGTEGLFLRNVRWGWTAPMVEAGLRRLTIELGRLPTAPDIEKAAYLPSRQTVYRVFGCGLKRIREICRLEELI